ncbi:hypothetical protein DXX99_08995 [Ammonifex thiophilus]|uniref:Uncharacterized protein n=1 Tax=Ammonifex thiophilus TaxID=444093 RepID=A0A3D8P1N1_9THEO|nr:hypothetical protein DXX99_08995 [Ammonifex thiophilus]
MAPGLKRELKEEKSEWKKRAIKKRLKEVRSELKALRRHLQTLQSGESEPASRQPVYRRKEPVRGRPLGWRRKAWRVLSAALTVPYLEKLPQVRGMPRELFSLEDCFGGGEPPKAGGEKASSCSWCRDGCMKVTYTLLYSFSNQDAT